MDSKYTYLKLLSTRSKEFCVTWFFFIEQSRWKQFLLYQSRNFLLLFLMDTYE